MNKFFLIKKIYNLNDLDLVSQEKIQKIKVKIDEEKKKSGDTIFVLNENRIFGNVINIIYFSDLYTSGYIKNYKFNQFLRNHYMELDKNKVMVSWFLFIYGLYKFLYDFLLTYFRGYKIYYNFHLDEIELVLDLILSLFLIILKHILIPNYIIYSF